MKKLSLETIAVLLAAAFAVLFTFIVIVSIENIFFLR